MDNEIDLQNTISDSNNVELLENDNLSNEIVDNSDPLLAILSSEDRYYNDVLTYLNNIDSNVNSLLTVNNNIATQNETIITSCYCITFIICLIFIYNFCRNMIRR